MARYRAERQPGLKGAKTQYSLRTQRRICSRDPTKRQAGRQARRDPTSQKKHIDEVGGAEDTYGRKTTHESQSNKKGRTRKPRHKQERRGTQGHKRGNTLRVLDRTKATTHYQCEKRKNEVGLDLYETTEHEDEFGPHVFMIFGRAAEGSRGNLAIPRS